MSKQRKTYSAELKARIALEAIKGQMTVNQIALHYGVHANQVTQWKQHALAQLPQIFSRAQARSQKLAERPKTPARASHGTPN